MSNLSLLTIYENVKVCHWSCGVCYSLLKSEQSSSKESSYFHLWAPCSPGSHHTEHLEGNNLHFIYVQSHCSVRCKTSPSQGGLCLAVLSWEAWTMSVLVASSTLLTTGSKAPGGAFPKPCFLSLSRKIHTLPPDKKDLRWGAGSKSKNKDRNISSGHKQEEVQISGILNLVYFLLQLVMLSSAPDQTLYWIS